MRVTVNVTQEHIDNGEKGSGTACPIALCLADLGITDLYVGQFGLYERHNLSDGSTLLGERYKVPLDVSMFVGMFDNGIDVKPISFEVYLSEHLISTPVENYPVRVDNLVMEEIQ